MRRKNNDLSNKQVTAAIHENKTEEVQSK